MYEKLIERMKRLGYNNHMIRLARELIIELQKRGIHSVEKFVGRLKRSVHDKGEYLDILREGRFAIILAGNKFSNIHIEYCERGPDLKADWNRNTVYFDVRRRRPYGDNQAIHNGAAFVPCDKAETIISIIKNKLKQFQSGELNIVVLWSDTIGLSLTECKEAFYYVNQEIYQNPAEYKKLSGVLFTESGEAIYPTRFTLFSNAKALKPLGMRLTEKLASLKCGKPKQLQKGMQAMASALREVMNKE